MIDILLFFGLVLIFAVAVPSLAIWLLILKYGKGKIFRNAASGDGNVTWEDLKNAKHRLQNSGWIMFPTCCHRCGEEGLTATYHNNDGTRRMGVMFSCVYCGFEGTLEDMEGDDDDVYEWEPEFDKGGVNEG